MMALAGAAADAIADEREGTAPTGLRTLVVQRLSQPLRFLMVGGCGLMTDVGFFSVIYAWGAHPLVARAFSLALATLITWRLNRHFTFARSGRHQADEAIRYAAVAAMAQGTGYLIFAVLALTILSRVPQIAIVVGAAAVTLISYNGQRLIAFLPHKARPNSRIEGRPS